MVGSGTRRHPRGRCEDWHLCASLERKTGCGPAQKGYTQSKFLASDPGGIDQVGCVYTAQGFEFDYIGVIFGRDLRYDSANGLWVGNPVFSHDHVVKRRSGARFTDNVKNTYRVLLTRGMQGCYVYFADAETRAFVESRL